jgi:hypothetical protein
MPASLVILGAVAGSIGIATSTATIIKLLDSFSVARNAEDSIKEITTQLDLERLRFFLWCNSVGCLDMLVAMNEDGTFRSDKRHEVFSAAGEQIQSLIENLVFRLIHNLQNKLEKSQPLFRRYTVPREPDYLRELRATYNLQDAWATRRLDTLALLEERRCDTGLGPLKKAHWAANDKDKFEELLEFFRQTNDDLNKMLNEFETPRINRQLAAIVTTTSLTRSLAEIDTSNTTTTDEVYSLAQMAQREEFGDSLKIPRQIAWKLLRLTLSDLELPRDGKFEATARVYGRYQSAPVLVEWRYYPRSSTTDHLDMLRSRVHMLAIQLQQSSKLAQCQLLLCLGHFHDEKEQKFGMVFAYPPRCTKKPMTIFEIMKDDLRSNGRRDLDDRYRAARLLTGTLYSLFSVRWFHKNICANSILFFDSDDTPGKFVLGQPYLCAFDFSRSDSPAELTETLPSRTYDSQTAFERRVYKHPELDRVQRSKDAEQDDGPRYRREYDVYSLGIVLLELGYWCPVAKLVREIPREQRETLDLAWFRRILQDNYVPGLRHRMGRAYADVVRYCLAADPENNEDSTTTPLERTHYLSKTRQFLESFDQLVISGLEKPFHALDV